MGELPVPTFQLEGIRPGKFVAAIFTGKTYSKNYIYILTFGKS